jgi:hypothetical protein
VSAPPPNTHGWRAPWRRQWGPLSDGRSRLSRLAARIERELRQEYLADTPLHARLVHRAAAYEALAEATLHQIGSDPKATKRAVTALQGTADRLLSRVPMLSRNGGHGHDLASVVTQAHNASGR